MEGSVASTSVHIPKALVEELDRVAAERGISRNRLIVEACRRVVSERRDWPEGFFSNAHLLPDDLAELERHADAFSDAILAARRSRTSDPL
jgi:hypothetical protein